MGFSCVDGGELVRNVDVRLGGEIRTREIAVGMIRAEPIAETLGKDQPRGSGE